ncbi:MAG: hypothetical protein JRJ18_10725 [Deltaproteobacteria bacterium]|nr:hypothetical protein [Deltaproteobacteria bacterium]MBW2008301.1 hypothetical protein [Deltaproteobacteria bacterium]
MPTRYPIILAHGICPFDRALGPFFSRDNADTDGFHYFRKIRSTLRAQGFEVFHSRVSWASALSLRALGLKRELERITHDFSRRPRVHIIAHSMGGLDARWMIYTHRMEDRVASLTTIGTPHRGTAFADWGLRRFGFLIKTARTLGLDIQGFRDLAREACERRNRILEGFEATNGVFYRTVAGAQPLERIFPPLRPSYRIILREEGENDGLVSVRSAMWREDRFWGLLDADHFNQLGWWDPSEARTGVDRRSFEKGIREVYLELARGLEAWEQRRTGVG